MKSPRRRSLLIISTSLSSCLFKLTSAASSASSSSRASSRLSTSSSSSNSSSSWLSLTRRNLVDRKYRHSRSAGILRGSLSRRGGSSSSMSGGGDDLTKLLAHPNSSGSDTMNHGSNGSKNTTTLPTASSILSSLFSTNYNSYNQNGNNPNNLITYSSCSVRGTRPYMEDEYFISEEGRFAAVFDGHGGSAVSQYLRQNLYAYVQAALPSCVNSLLIDELLDGNKNDSSKKGENGKKNAQVDENNTIDNNSNKKNHNHKIIQSIVEKALRTALSKVDHEVQGISHWSFQGSTALALLFYNNPYDEHDNCSKNSRYIATANIGDSRAVLSRNAHAIDLTQDHKPNSPSERRRIESLGGTVDWCGEVDSDGNPVKDMGVYRLNGNLALSRAIGDRSERPWVTSEADVRHFLIEEGGANDDSDAAIRSGDEFVVMATDGLFDVFASQDVVNFIHGVLEETALDTQENRNETRKNMARTVVEEALRRGTYDNVTVLILWLNR
mmetsp:Transcript_14220/g.30160  ORF Transcript_14220/g.30160 Transcript_14220/m.30160 type:complete len:498 (+) Transcript_14220:55-1548(+)